MERFRRIYAGIDFSPASDEALRQAHRRAIECDAALAVCHIVPNELPGHILFFPQSTHLEHAKVEASARVTQVTGRSSGEFDLIIDEGTPYYAFLVHAEKWSADLIVVGSHGATAAAGTVLGSFAGKVIRHAHSPVLIARPLKGSGRIVAGTDFSDLALTSLKAAASEARRSGAELTVVHSVDVLWPPAVQATNAVDGAPEASIEKALSEMESAGKETLDEAIRKLDFPNTSSRVTVGPAASELIEVATQLGADLLVVGTLGRTGLRRALLGSVAEAVATGAPCSVLVVRHCLS